MDSGNQSELTQILRTLLSEKVDEHKTLDRVFELVYEELHNIATHMMRSERPDHTLQPTALVHEAYGCLAGLDERIARIVEYLVFSGMSMKEIAG